MKIAVLNREFESHQSVLLRVPSLSHSLGERFNRGGAHEVLDRYICNASEVRQDTRGRDRKP